jgi:hypothetical protein
MTATLALRGDAGPITTEKVLADAAAAPRQRGLDRAVIVLGLALLRWAGRRADRRPISREQQLRAFAALRDAEIRRHHTQSVAMRVS